MIRPGILCLWLVGACAITSPRNHRSSLALVVPSTKPIVIAHRGASCHRPEHTIEAYALGIEMGADYIEPDLVMTSDGVLVARHENEIAATTDAAARFPNRRTTKVVDGEPVEGWFVEDFTLAELRSLRARERLPFRSHAFDGMYRIPTFAEILDHVDSAGRRRGKAVGVYPELKHPEYFRRIGLDLESRLLSALRQRNLDRADAAVFVQSFDSATLRRLRPQTKVKLVQLVFDSTQTTPQALARIATYADVVGAYARLVVPAAAGSTATSLVRDAHAAGLLVHVWTLRPEPEFLPERYAGDPLAEVRELAALGVDGLFSDCPDLVLRGLGR